MTEHAFTCPACSGTITADDEMTLIRMVHEHAHDHHRMHLTEEKIREMLETQREG